MDPTSLPDGERVPWARAFGTLGGRLRYYRERRDMSREDLGHLIRRSSSAICRWENNQHAPSVAMLARVATALRTPVAQLMPPEHRAPVVDDRHPEHALTAGVQVSLLEQGA